MFLIEPPYESIVGNYICFLRERDGRGRWWGPQERVGSYEDCLPSFPLNSVIVSVLLVNLNGSKIIGWKLDNSPTVTPLPRIIYRI